jgi:hypothetical protein
MATEDPGRGGKATDMLRRLPPFPLGVLLACALIVIVVSLFQNLLAGLVEAALLILGLWSSYVLGQSSVTAGDVRPRVRGSYRRMATLYGQLYGLTRLVGNERDALDRDSEGARERAVASLGFIEFSIGQNLSVVADAMEDWADMVPDEVSDLRRQMLEARADQNNIQEYNDEIEVLRDPDEEEDR